MRECSGCLSTLLHLSPNFDLSFAINHREEQVIHDVQLEVRESTIHIMLIISLFAEPAFTCNTTCSTCNTTCTSTDTQIRTRISTRRQRRWPARRGAGWQRRRGFLPNRQGRPNGEQCRRGFECVTMRFRVGGVVSRGRATDQARQQHAEQAHRTRSLLLREPMPVGNL